MQFEDYQPPVPFVAEGGGFMPEALAPSAGSRRNEDIALDLMKFIAITTGYGKIGTPGAGFQGGPPSKPAEYADHLLELYSRCLAAVQEKK